MSCFKKISLILSIFITISIFFSINTYANNDVLDEVKNIVKNYYVYDSDYGKIYNSNSIEEIIKNLNDPYTIYFSKKQYKNFIAMTNKKYSDIGASLDTSPKGLKVISVLDNSPAYNAGIIPGDIIIEIDGRVIEGINADIAAEYVKGEENTRVHLKVIREDKIIEFDVLRSQRNLSTLDGKVLNGHIGYIKISTFGKDTPSEFRNVLINMEEANVDNYIIDLRFNPGGYLQSSIDLAGYFIGNNIALITNDKLEGETKHYASSDNIINKPIIFLVNEYSASASEVLIAAIKDYNKALIIGNRTYGKGLVQSVFNLSDGSVFKMSVKTFCSPKGNVINKVGIKPDIQIKDVDALKTALFLIQSPASNRDKTGYQLLNIGNRAFEVDLNKLKKLYNWEIYQNIISNNANAQVFNGYKIGWNKIYDIKEKPYNIFYPGYKYIGNISNANPLSSFNVMFPRNFLKCSMNNSNIELISLSTGNKIPINIKFINSKSITLIPIKELRKNQSYFLVIHPGVKDFNNKGIGGTVTYITVL